MFIKNNSQSGKVVLVGAGPGDPELITLKALRYLQQADVIITDRLVSPELLEWAKPHSEIIFAGKQGGNSNSSSQKSINELLIDSASQHKLVVRLKGGDVSVFSNVFDELETLVAHQIPFEIVPGITAASGASAYAGIPLTAQGYAASVRFLIYTNPATVSNSLLKEWAETNDTLVFYMASMELTSLLERLIENNIDHINWVAAIEQATTPCQRVHSYPIHQFLNSTKGITFASPTLIIIGKVVQLHHQFNWFDVNKSKEGTDYFKTITTQLARN
jgi:uroporphyrin-III C-methyltransferase/precorrin-2 dehydrogenase/sirohydrochlorin ferrochelatase/uroporphyrin-III C-methyltransferase